MAVTLTEEQESILSSILSWLSSDAPTLTLGGLAGTGKSTIIAELLRRLPTRPAVATFTGKAASVLRRKGIDHAQTLHSYLYDCHPGPKGRPIFEPITDFSDSLLVIDEASMLSAELNDTITTHFIADHSGKVLYVGDHGQLEPVGDNPNLMQSPQLRLETIHRQALHSPILRFAHHLRTGNRPKDFFIPDPLTENAEAAARALCGELLIRPRSEMTADASFQFICAYNPTRTEINKVFREHLGYHNRVLCEGEKVICLRNNPAYAIFNGLMGTVTKVHSIEPRFIHFDFLPDGFPEVTNLISWREQFGASKLCDLWGLRRSLPHDLADITFFDFAYCITCHKSQGSEWDKVAVLEEPSRLWSMPRWRYTAVTRAAKTLHYYLP